MWRNSLFGLLYAAALAVADTETIAPTSIDELGWLAGCWAHVGRDEGSVEPWLPPAGGAMLAVSRIIRDGRMVSYEFLRVEETRDGSLRLIAMPVGQAATAFALATIGDKLVVFENPDHDFPQRLRYRLVDPDRLLATAEADSDGQHVSIDFPMTRADCAVGE